jgi:hypothetical protein
LHSASADATGAPDSVAKQQAHHMASLHAVRYGLQGLIIIIMASLHVLLLAQYY